jgi:hypothetical protein
MPAHVALGAMMGVHTETHFVGLRTAWAPCVAFLLAAPPGRDCFVGAVLSMPATF